MISGPSVSSDDVIEIREAVSSSTSSRRSNRRRRRDESVIPIDLNDQDIGVVEMTPPTGRNRPSSPEIVPHSPSRNTRRRNIKPNYTAPLPFYKDSVLIDLTSDAAHSFSMVNNAESSSKASPPIQTEAMQRDEIVSTLLKALNCSICQFEMKEMTSTKCGHTFCEQCIKQAIRINKKCPTCRKTTTMKDLHRVYL
jgi:hypothetical protein